MFARLRAARMAEERGWSVRTLGAVTDGLRRVLADHDTGPVTASTAAERLTASHSRIRVFEVLEDLELLEDDRDVSTRAWIDKRSAELPAGFRTDVHDWLVWLLDGDARTRPRSRMTVHVHFGQARPVLLAWGGTRDRLREVTRADIQDALAQLRGQRRFNTSTALKPLFGFATKYRRVFANPTAGLSVPHGSIDNLLTLTDEEITTIETTATTPAQRLASPWPPFTLPAERRSVV